MYSEFITSKLHAINATRNANCINNNRLAHDLLQRHYTLTVAVQRVHIFKLPQRASHYSRINYTIHHLILQQSSDSVLQCQL